MRLSKVLWLFCRKLILFNKNITPWHRLIRTFSKEVRSNSFLLNHFTTSTIITIIVPVHQRHLPESPSRKSTLQSWVVPLVPNFNHSVQVILWSYLHFPSSSITADTAFRKDLSLQGCTMFATRTVRPITCTISSLPGKAGWVGTVSTSPSLRTFQDHQWL